jgi:hypothetical protein
MILTSSLRTSSLTFRVLLQMPYADECEKMTGASLV